MVGPWIAFIPQLVSVRRRLSDIEYLSIKEFEGKLVTNTGQKADGTTGDLATLTASSGKDMYLAKAQASIRFDATTALILGEIVLKVNGVIKDRWEWGGVLNTETGLVEDSHNFTIVGLKVTTGQIIKLEVISSDADVDINGTIECFEETTGTSPKIT